MSLLSYQGDLDSFMGLKRRDFLKGTAGAVISSYGAPWVIAAETPNLTISVDPRSPLYQIKDLAEKELGIQLTLRTGQYSDRMQQAILQSDENHLYEFRATNTHSLWRSKVIRAIDTAQIGHWDEIHQTLSWVEEQSAQNEGTPTFGAPPNSALYAQENDSLGSQRAPLASHVPLFLSSESFAFNGSQLPEVLASQSWNCLLNNQARGRVSLSNSPATAYYSLAMATGKGVVANPAKPDPDEIKALYDRLVTMAADGQFSRFWSTPEDLVRPMLSGDTLIANVISQDMPFLRDQGVNIQQASPDEGFLSWSTALFLASSASQNKTQLAYRFINWLTAGRAGAEFSRMGYTSSTPEKSKEFMSENDWGYWYGGDTTSAPIYDPNGYPVAAAGETRAGGSFQNRFQNIGLWANTPIPHMELILENWSRMMLAG